MGPKLASEAIRFKSLRAIRHHSTSLTIYKRNELFDLFSDISKKNNLAFNQTYMKVRKRMLKNLGRIGPCPCNRKNEFSLKSAGGQMKGKKVECTCSWFQENRNVKCNNYPKEDLYCI